MTYKEMWRWLREQRAVLETAADFYATSPTGQYRREAEIAIRAVLAQMAADDKVKRFP